MDKQKRNNKEVYSFMNKQLLCEDISTIGSIVKRRKLNRKELYSLVDGEIKITELGWYLK